MEEGGKYDERERERERERAGVVEWRKGMLWRESVCGREREG